MLDTSFPYRVVADGCIDIFFDYNQPQESFVMGFATEHTAFALGKTFHYAGVRFLPGMFPLLFGIKAAALSDRSSGLDSVIPPMAAYLGSRVAEGQSEKDRNSLLDAYLLQHLSGQQLREDARFLEALLLILEQSGSIPVEQISTGVSPRQLRRLFEQYIGDTPKAFSKVVRFQKLLQAAPDLRSMREDKRFFDLGYYDQAHFIREFRQLYGLSPTQVFRH